MTDGRDDPLAAELALGLLEGDERAAALRRVLAEPGFATEVERWRDDFAELFASVPAVEPPPGLLGQIEASLDGAAAPLPRRRWLWPSVAGVTSLAAAASLALLLSRPMPTPVPVPVPVPPATLLAAAIAPVSGAAAPVSAVWEPATGTLRLSAARLAGPRHAAELWVIGGDGVPHSLGLLQPGARTAMSVTPANRARLGPSAVLAVSVEPMGGSPTGLPTGPVVAKGTLSVT